jgi:hypothetical protein
VVCVYCAVGSEYLNKIQVKRRYRFDFHTKCVLRREQHFFNFLDLWIYCLYPSCYSETYKWAGSQLRMTATLTFPTFRVPCYLLLVAVMARLMQLYRLFKKEMFILRFYRTLIACVYLHYYDTGNSTDLVRIMFMRPDVDKTGSVFFKIFLLRLCVLKISLRLDYWLLSGW